MLIRVAFQINKIGWYTILLVGLGLPDLVFFSKIEGIVLRVSFGWYKNIRHYQGVLSG